MRTKIILALVPAIASLSACSTMAESVSAPSFTANLMRGDVRAGTATVTGGNGGGMLDVAVEGLAPGEYGMHIHTTGKCEMPGYASAGAHWNPAGKAHGSMNAAGPHRGDLPNLTVIAGQTARLQAPIDGIPLSGTDGLMDSDGAAFIIHAKPDDMKTDPSGNSGDRIICGVFKAS
jgi:superoxide dismutase, Cu-Zn family